jgi:hypothetical protein
MGRLNQTLVAEIRRQSGSKKSHPCGRAITSSFIGFLLAPTYARVPQGRIFSQSKIKELG